MKIENKINFDSQNSIKKIVWALFMQFKKSNKKEKKFILDTVKSIVSKIKPKDYMWKRLIKDIQNIATEMEKSINI